MSRSRYSILTDPSRPDQPRRDSLATKLNTGMMAILLALFGFGLNQVANRLDKISDQLTSIQSNYSALAVRVQRSENDIAVLERRLNRNP